MPQLFLTIAALFGGLSVAAGAFATHSLRPQLSDRALEIFEAGARYQMYHALALLAVGLWLTQANSPIALYGNNIVTGGVVSSEQAKTVTLMLSIAGYAFIAGVLIFSGSLYALSLTNIRWLGAIAPIGGVALIVGWICLAIAALNYR